MCVLFPNDFNTVNTVNKKRNEGMGIPHLMYENNFFFYILLLLFKIFPLLNLFSLIMFKNKLTTRAAETNYQSVQ